MEKPEKTITTIKVVTTLVEGDKFKVETTSEGDIPLTQENLNAIGSLAVRFGQANEIAQGITSITPDDLFPGST